MNNIKTAFDGIRAEEKLKPAIKQYLNMEIKRRCNARRHTLFKRYAIGVVSFFILFISGIFTYRIYFTPAAFVDVDVNPSIEIVLNKFDRVIGIYAYNRAGDDIIEGLNLTHRGYRNAITSLMENMTKQGYLQDDVLVSVTLQTDNKGREKDLLVGIQSGVESYIAGHHHTAQIDVFPIGGDTRIYSHEQGVSPAKYLAILELIEVDPSASVESCRAHSISEIKLLALEHEHHHDDDGHVHHHGHETGHHGESGNKHR